MEIAEIFMGLKDGSLESFIQSNYSGDLATLGRRVAHHMLLALAYLALENVVHCDVKPANILYTNPSADALPHFVLGDFGLCNDALLADTPVGTPIFKAPEILERKGHKTKADVWSLFVTLLWTLNEGCGGIFSSLPSFHGSFCFVLDTTVHRGFSLRQNSLPIAGHLSNTAVLM